MARSTLLSLGMVCALAGIARADGGATNDDGERMLRRAAYYETQKGENEKALATYEEVIARFPDSKFALQATERVAVVRENMGDAAAAKKAQDEAVELRKKLGISEPAAKDDKNARARRREKLRERLQRRDGEPKPPQEPKPDVPRAPDDPSRPPAPPPPPKAGEGSGDPLPPDLRTMVEKLKADGKSPEEIRALVRETLRDRVREKIRARRGDDGKEPPKPPAPSQPPAPPDAPKAGPDAPPQGEPLKPSLLPGLTDEQRAKVQQIIDAGRGEKLSRKEIRAKVDAYLKSLHPDAPPPPDPNDKPHKKHHKKPHKDKKRHFVV